jgi:hypothetical protein
MSAHGTDERIGARNALRRRSLCVAVLCASIAAASGCGTSDGERALLLRSADSSWVQGQASLAGSPAFIEIAARAQELAARRLAARKRELALIEAARIAAKKREREERLRAYLEAKRRAEAAYRAALRRAALERKRQLAKLAEARRRRAEQLRRLNEKLRVDPGEECRDPELRNRVRCQVGRLPTRK